MNKRWIKSMLSRSGALRLASRLTGEGVAVVMYHSVMDGPTHHETALGGIHHPAKVFTKQMEIVARDFHPVSLDEVLGFLREGRQIPSRAVVITFDDGYKDNFEVAAPVLKRLGIPATFYVAVECVERAELPWPAKLRHAFAVTGNDEWKDPSGRRWALPTQWVQAFDAASEQCGRLAGEVQERFVTSVVEELDAKPLSGAGQLMMTWDQVRALVRQGHIVGSHTMTHPNMAYLGDLDLKREFTDSKFKLEKQLSAPVVHFSYPCPALQPHWSERTVKACGEVGYLTAVTSTGGIVRRGADPLSLRRIRPTKDVEGLRWNLECTFLGRAV